MRRWSALLVLASALACVGAVWPRSVLAADPPGSAITIQPLLPPGTPHCDDVELPFSYFANSPCVGDSIYFRFRSCDPCIDLWSSWWDEATHTLNLVAILWPQQCDPDPTCSPDSVIGFAGLATQEGIHPIRIRVQTTVVYDSLTCISERFIDAAYYARDCGNPPPPPPPPPAEDSLQFVDQVTIGSSGLVCQGVEYPVQLSGINESDCYSFRRIELVPSPLTVIGPPILRVVFAQNECVPLTCGPDSLPWQAQVDLPPLPAGDYRLRIESAIQVTCGQDSAVTVTGAGSFAYVVSDSCGEPPPPPIPPCPDPQPLPITLRVLPACPQPADTVYLQAMSPCEACLDLQSIGYEPGVGWVVRATSGPLENCSLMLCAAPDVVTVPLGQLAAGNYVINVTKLDVVTNDSTGAQCLIREQEPFSFAIGGDCPPPPQDTVQYLSQVFIGTPDCPNCPGVVCQGQDYDVLLRGNILHACYEFRRVEIIHQVTDTRNPPLPPMLRIVFAEKDCFVTPCDPETTGWSASVRLEALPNLGNYSLAIQSAILLPCGNDSSLTITGTERFPFTVTDSCGVPPPPPQDTIPYPLLQRVAIQPGCPLDSIRVGLAGYSREWAFLGAEVVPSPIMAPGWHPDFVRLHFRRFDCPTPTVPQGVGSWQTAVWIPGLPAGNYHLPVEAYVHRTCNGQDSLVNRYGETFPFAVRDTCGGDSLYGIDRVVIGMLPCPTCPPIACENQPIPVRVAGTLDETCVRFLRLEQIPPPPGVIGAPTLLAVFARSSCLGPVCVGGQFPWQSATMLDGLPPGRYSLPIQSVMRTFDCAGDSTEALLGSRVFQFTVLDSCPEPPPSQACLWLGWARPGTGDPCDARVGPGAPAKLQLQMRATTPIAGFQGKLFLTPFGLHIQDVRAVGAAQGMRVLWNPWPGGASFVLYSENGQLLPPCNPLVDCAGCCEFHSVLEVTVAVDDSLRFAPITELLVWEVIAADSLANPVSTCIFDGRDRARMTAHLCADKPCDANADGFTDVRDLVTMVNCLHAPGGCPADSAGTSLDCQHDGDVDLDDVLCCAHFLLHGQMPDSAETVPAPQVRLRLGKPVATSTGVDVPARLEGSGWVTAARFGLDIPLEFFDLTGVTVAGGRADDWLALHEQRDGNVAAGLIRLHPSPQIPEQPEVLEFTIHLRLRPGQQPGGQLWIQDGDYTGTGGQGLIPGAGDRSVQLGTATVAHELMLARPQPNPFSREATLALSLERETEVELTVHDLTGRLVATVHRGRLAAGPHTFMWRGTFADGTPAANGVYFVRAQVGGRVLSQKVALLRGR